MLNVGDGEMLIIVQKKYKIIGSKIKFTASNLCLYLPPLNEHTSGWQRKTNLNTEVW